MKAIPAVYQDGVFHPLSPVELPEQTSVEVLLPTEAKEVPGLEGLSKSAGAWADLPGVDDALKRMDDLRLSAEDRE